MGFSRKRLKLILIHILVWIAYAGFNHFVNIANYGHAYALDTIAKYLVAAFIFYGNTTLLLPNTFKKRNYLLFSFSLIALAFFSFGLKELLIKGIFPIWGFPKSPYTSVESFIQNLWWWFQYTLLGFGYWFANELLSNEREKTVLANKLLEKEREKTALEKERLHLEYAFLKSQINPHFLYNVLNFFYARSLGGSEQLSNGILCLAEIMRYIINSEEDEFGLIPLEKEIHQIQNIIDINQLRFDGKLSINFDKEGDFTDVKVIPYVFVTLVENVFKHGELSDSAKPVIIKLIHNGTAGFLIFSVKNGKSNQPSEGGSGIGLRNIQRRLNYTYGNKHTFQIKENSESYIVDLQIELGK